MILDYQKTLEANGFLQKMREEQADQWMNDIIIHHLKVDFFHHKEVRQSIGEISEKVRQGTYSSKNAA